jgi:hypothetical protein
MSQSVVAHGPIGPLWRTAPWGTQWGQMDGPPGRARLEPPGSAVVCRGPGDLRAPLPSELLCPGLTPGVPADGAPSGGCARPPVKIVTWLILPVVICLSQRLSHACLSISTYTVKLRMAH